MAFKSKNRRGKGNSSNKKGEKPVITLRAPHGLKVSTWENEYKSETRKGETFIAYSCLPARAYFDEDKDEYVDTHYMREDDLLPMAQLLIKTWNVIQASKAEDEPPEVSHAESNVRVAGEIEFDDDGSVKDPGSKPSF